ncbi:hypothetical protein CPB86DRAFT_787755 [Serendipita vermifera]|nr:hypothetical protein CPB86DRAFT_787755 [Serendipita vermifera]
MENMPADGYNPKSKAILKLISAREREIELIKAEIYEMDYKADQDIYQRWECADRFLRPLRGRQVNPMGEVEDYTIFRTARLLEEQDPIFRQIRSLRRANTLSRASIAGMNKIPEEVLGLIFQEFVGMNHSVWRLVDVCQRWKHLALATPQLWSSITIACDHYARYYQSKRYSHHGRSHPCRDLDQLKLCLDRSGSVALDIILEHESTWGKPCGQMTECLRFLNGPDVIIRVKSLVINVESRELMDAWPECFLFASFQRLEHLEVGKHISEKWHTNLLHAISRTLPCLRTLQTYGSLESILLPEQVWQGLKSFQFGDRSSSSKIDGLVGNFSHVEELTCLSSPWPSLTSPSTVFANLRSATFCAQPSSFRRLQLPVIQNLRIFDDYWVSSPTTLDLMTFPRLTSLEVKSRQPDKWLTNVSMDQLSYLRLFIPNDWMECTALKGTSLETFSRLQTLFLVSSSTEAVTIRLLELLPSLTSFTFAPTLYFEGYGLRVIPRLTEYRGNFSCSPNLKELMLGDGPKWHIQTRRGPLVPLIKQLIKTRAMHSAALCKLEVLWRDCQEPTSYI